MSVLIKNMEMPSGLAERGFVIRGDGRVRTFTGAIINECCAVEVPTPHGRLIDADALITTFCEWGVRLERGRKLTITMCEAKQAIVDIIEDAPTVIEAEE